MKLLQAIEIVTVNDAGLIDKIKECISDRVDWLDEREPESNGMIYDEWSEKESELSDILSDFECCIDDGITEDDLTSIMERIADFQMTYGGLSRLKV